MLFARQYDGGGEEVFASKDDSWWQQIEEEAKNGLPCALSEEDGHTTGHGTAQGHRDRELAPVPYKHWAQRKAEYMEWASGAREAYLRWKHQSKPLDRLRSITRHDTPVDQERLGQCLGRADGHADMYFWGEPRRQHVGRCWFVL